MSQVATTVCILDAHHGASPHYASWRGGLSVPSIVVDEFDESWVPPPEVGVVVTLQHYMLPNVGILRRLVAQNEVPVLIVADGILEYRNTWSRTDFPAGNIFQPILGHKFACVGRSQARILESWGNIGKCEVVGLPRTDPLRGRSPRTRNPADPITILVMTAKTPGFNDEQRAAVLQSLRDLRDWLAGENRDVLRYHAVWRVTGNLADELEIPAQNRDSTEQDLSHRLAEVDIVVTTPSTAALEAMLYGIPVALLDYTNSPHYVAAAWTMTASQHIPATIPDLVKRTPARMLWQDTILHDSLECESSAADRMVELVEGLVACCQTSKAAGRPLTLPERMLRVSSTEFHSPEPRFNFTALYPHHQIAGQYTEAALSLELGHAHLDRTRYLKAWHESLLEAANVRRDLVERDARLIQLHQEVTQRDVALIRLHERVAEGEAAQLRQREEVERLKAEIAVRSETICQMQKGEEERLSALRGLQEVLSSRDAEIAALRQELSDLNRQLTENQFALAEAKAACSLTEEHMDAQRRLYEDQLRAHEGTITTRIAGLVKWPFR